MVAAATLLKEKIEQGWLLGGVLSKVSIGSGSTLMDEVVQFFDRKQVVGNEVAKSVTVEKINAEGDEGVTRHPTFKEISDIYEITLYYRLTDVQSANFTTDLDNIENMAQELNRILINIFDPTSSQVGIYFKTASSWINEDVYTGNQPELRRKLRLHLITILSEDPEVYNGRSGVLVFDTSASVGDSKPGLDFIYAGVESIKIREGYSQIPLLTKDVTNGVGVPFQMRGLFSGTFTGVMTAVKSDILGSTLDKIQKMYLTQSGSSLKRQNATVVLLHTVNNAEGVTFKVSEINVTNPGAGYTSVPAVSFSGGSPSSPAVAFATIEDGRVTGIVVTSPGDAYDSAPTVIIAAPTGGSPVQATAVSTIINETTKKFQTQSFMKINEIYKDSIDEDLLRYTINGTLTKPSIFTEPA